MDLAKFIAEKKEDILSVARKHGATNVRVFGSVARGDFRESSDIDILINLNQKNFEGMRYFGVLEELREELEELLGRRVDVIDERGLKGKIREEILAEAVSL